MERLVSSHTVSGPAVSVSTSDWSRVVAVGVLLLAFLPTLLAFGPLWHGALPQGYPTLALCAWLLWRDRRAVLVMQRPHLWVAPLLAGLSLLWLAAGVLAVQVVQLAVLPLLAWSWLLTTAGWPAARTALPIAATFGIAIPVWEVLIRPLQSLTVLANAMLLRIARIDAAVHGDFIRVPAGTFHVAEGCAGINYVQVGLLVGVAYALLFLRTWPVRARVVMVMAAAVIGMNWLRVFGLVVIGHATEMRSPLVRDHGTYGWILFGLAVGGALLVARRLERREIGATAAAAPAPMVPPNRVPSREGRPHSPGHALRLATGLALIGPLLHLATAHRTPPDAAALAAQARVTPPAGWEPVTTAPTGAFAPDFRGADLASRTTWTRDGVVVQVDHLLYATQAQGKELIRDGNEIAPDSLRLAAPPAPALDPDAFTPEATVVRTAGGPRLVWHWYRVAGRVTASPARAKLLELRAFAQRQHGSALIAVSARCHDPRCDEAARSLRSFVEGGSLHLTATSR